MSGMVFAHVCFSEAVRRGLEETTFQQEGRLFAINGFASK
jgi:hypothetical protein